MQLTDETWARLSGRGAPTTIRPLGTDRGFSASLWHLSWADGHTAVLKTSRDRRRGARERQLLRALALKPRLLGAVEEADRILLLLEDLSAARPGDILAGASVEEAEQMLDELGRLHALPVPAGLPDGPPRWRSDTPDHIDAFLARCPHPWGRAHLRRLPDALPHAVPILASAPRGIIHADAHLDNWMFCPAPILIDWEAARVGPCVVDVVRVLMEGIHADVRRSAGDRLLSRWCAQVGAAPAEARRWLRAGLWYSLNAMLSHHATVDLDAMPERMRRVHRHCAWQAMELAADFRLESDGRPQNASPT